MPSGQTVITNTLGKLGLVPQGGAPSTSDSTYCLAELNNMWSAWGIDEGLIYGQQTFQAALAAGKAVYAIGSGGTADFNTPRPQRIYKAFVMGVVAFTATTTSASKTLTAIPDTSNLSLGQQVIGAGIPANSFITAIVTNTSATITNAATASATLTATIYVTTGNRNEIKLVDAGTYYDHNDLGASAATPDELYADYLTSGTDGTMNLYLFPVPKVAPLALELDMAVIFANWALATVYQIPPGYQDAIEWALAFRVMPAFGAAVNSTVAQLVATEAVKAEARLRAANSFDRQVPPQALMAPGTPQQPPQGA